jgi:predicted kinase
LLKETIVTYVYFDVPLTTALERNALREGRAKVPDSVIRKMYKSLQKPKDCVIIINEEGERVV